jgi:hypothetical protein
MLNFPQNPTVDQIYAPTDTTWRWSGYSWDIAESQLNLAGDISGTSLGNTIQTSLAQVNIIPGDYTNLSVDGKGRIVAIRALTSNDVTTALGFTPLDAAGAVMQGNLTLNAEPVQALDAATKAYVDRKALFALAVGF